MKRLAVLLCVSILLTYLLVPAGANVTPISVLTTIEEILYGEPGSGSLVERIERVEKDVFGSTQPGAAMLRIDRLNTFLQSTEAQGGSMKMHLNLAEWGFTGNLTDGQPLIRRLERLELEWYGQPQTGSIAERTKNLMLMIWGTTELDVKKVTLPAASLVKISLLTGVNSGTAKVGDQIPYRVVEDVVVDGRIVIPAGTESVAVVTEVSSAGRLGRDGRVVIDFGEIAAFDGTFVDLRVDQRATEKNKSLELAAGASMAGVMLLGPVGLVGGYFVKGKDVGIEARQPFYVETLRDVQLSGFILRPAL
ncbi:MAG: hypothetical protein GX205_04775 [Firmicutes bacterium]|nr:hypothetical protein [Bacillota bacterium]